MLQHKDEKLPQRALCSDLKELATRGIRRVFETIDKRGPKQLSTFFAAAEALYPGAVQQQSTDVFEELIWEAINRLPKGRVIDNTNIGWDFATPALFDLLADQDRRLGIEPFTKGKRYDQITDGLWRKARLHDSQRETFRESIHTIRQCVADTILKMVADAQGLRRETEQVSTGIRDNSGYVHRKDLEDRIFRGFLDCRKIALLHGDAGSGKSTLAKALASRLPGVDPTHDVAVIKGHTPESLQDSLYDVLRDFAGGCPDGSQPAMYRQFKDWITGDDSPAVVVLDNFDEPSLLDSLIPRVQEIKSRLIVTSRRRADLGDEDRVFSINIGNMAPAEADILLRLHTSGLNNDEVAHLAEALDYRPLALAHGSSCLMEKPYNGDFELFWAALCHNVVMVLDSYGKEHDSTLVAIYQMTIEQLNSFPKALQLLDIIACFGPYIDVDTVLPILWPSSGDEFWEKLRPEDEAALLKALRILEDRSLVNPNSSILMHLLTVEIVAELRLGAGTEAFVPAALCLRNRLNLKSWLGGRPLPHDWPAIAPVLMRFAHILMVNTNDRAASAHVDDLLAIIFRQQRQLGDIPPTLKDLVCLRVLRSVKRGCSPEIIHGEVLELGYLRDCGYEPEPGVSLLDAVRVINPDSYSFEASLSSEIRPLTRDYDPDALMALTEEMLPVCQSISDWTGEARLRYAIGVMLFEQSKWDDSQEWLESSLSLLEDFTNDFPEVGMLAAESARRLVELGRYSGSARLEDHYYAIGRKLVDDTRTCGSRAVDHVLDVRFSHTSFRGMIEVAPTSSVEAARAYLHPALTAVQNTIIRKYELLHLEKSLREARYDLCRILAISGDYWAAGEGFAVLTAENGASGYSDGASICNLATLKVRLVKADEYDSLLVSNLAMEIAMEMADRPYPSTFWLSDAICVAYSAAIRAQMMPEELEHYRSAASSLLEEIGRLDKLQRSVLVGSGEISPTELLKL